MRRQSNIVSIKKHKYGYVDIVEDARKMERRYGDYFHVSEMGRSLDSRKIFALCLGNPQAEHCVMMEAGLHGREWLNCQVVMANLEWYLLNYKKGIYKGVPYSELFDKVCVYILPAMNPDGICISQYGPWVIANSRWKRRVKKLAGRRWKYWKANARGVDLNRNYWPGFQHKRVGGPAPKNYCGPYPLSEPESKCLIGFMRKVNPEIVINYHEAGRVIYYTRSSSLLRKTVKLTGYRPVRENQGSYGSFGDWLEQKNKSYVTLETCFGRAPVPHWQVYSTCHHTREVIPMVAHHVYVKFYRK